jgi:hypothetical protein
MRAFKSGAEATAVQTLARLSSGSQLREASGLRRVHRRFSPITIELRVVDGIGRDDLTTGLSEGCVKVQP